MDFFDYLDEPLRSDILDVFTRKADPRGGKIDYDVDDHMAGNWFVEGANWLKGVPGAGSLSHAPLAQPSSHRSDADDGLAR